MSAYPELDKIHAVSKESESIGIFLEWLCEQGYHLAEYAEHTHTPDCWERDEHGHKQWLCGYQEGDNFVPVSYTINTLLAQYYNIDEAKAEQERRRLLESLRQ